MKLKKVSVLEKTDLDSSLAKMGIAVRHAQQGEGLNGSLSSCQCVGCRLNAILGKLNLRKPATLDRKTARLQKGIPRPYREAEFLNVIDPFIAPLVGQMNREPLIRTTGSCQGHGFWFVAVPPYVSFTTTVEIASTLAKVLNDDFYGPARRLNYFWELTARFDSNAELHYSLVVPGIASGRRFYATRRGLDQDFELLGKKVQEILDHFEGQNAEMEGKPD